MNFATLQHSVFLQALGSAILNSLWQGFIIWIIYETINISYKNASSAFKNKLSTFLIFISFCWFLTSFVSGFYIHENLPSNALSQAVIVLAESSKEPGFNLQSILSYTTGALPYLSVSYIFLLIFLMFKLFSSYRYVHFIANRRLLSPPGELQHFTSRVAAQLNITKKISVWLSNSIDVPAIIGFFKPIILIPVASINNLSSLQLEAIILHELSHIRRNDYITNLFISVIETILFFNPFVLLLAKSIKRERENCCDDFVIQYRYDPHSYASALLRLEQSRKSNVQLAIGAVSGKKQLLTRIKRITNGQVVSKQFNYGQKLLALLLVTFIICSVAWLSPQDKKNISNPAVHSDTKTFAKPAIKIETKPAESINITTHIQQTEINIANENLHHNRKLADPQSNFLHEPKREFNLINGEVDLNENKLTELNNKEFYVYDINNDTHQFFFDQNILKYVPLKLLENLSIKDFHIDIDINELNKNLKEAYKGINAMDWKKIQNDINESLSMLKADQLSEKEMSAFYEENFKNLLKARNEKSEKSKLRVIHPELRKKIILLDSLRDIEMSMARRPMRKVERWDEIPDAERLHGSGDNFYHYDFESVLLHESNFKKLPKSKNPKVFSISGSKNKNAKTIVENLTRAFKDSKNSFHYSITTNQVKENKEQKIITIGVNEIP